MPDYQMRSENLSGQIRSEKIGEGAIEAGAIPRLTSDIEEIADAVDRADLLLNPDTIRKADAAREAFRAERARLTDIAARIEDQDPALRDAVRINIDLIESAIDALINAVGYRR